MICRGISSRLRSYHMNTVTHIIVASAALSRKHAPARNRAVVAGALIPDFSIYVMSGWALATGRMNETLWQVTYWQEPWQILGAITNSVPLALILLASGVWRNSPVLSVLAGAMLIHAGLDFPLHADDAHRHFWPLSDWRFQSPISYWDPRHYGFWGGLLDFACLFAGLIVLWMQFEARWVRILLGILALLAAIIVAMIIASAWT